MRVFRIEHCQPTGKITTKPFHHKHPVSSPVLQLLMCTGTIQGKDQARKEIMGLRNNNSVVDSPGEQKHDKWQDTPTSASEFILFLYECLVFPEPEAKERRFHCNTRVTV